MNKAFTIVEVLVVISILGLIMGIGSVRLRDFQRKQEIVSVKRQMLTDVRAAQSDAGSGRKPTDCAGTLEGYGFRAKNPPSSYEIFVRCSTSGDSEIKSVQLPSTISYSLVLPPGATNPIIFKPLQQGNNIPSGSVVRINISGTSVSHTERLDISASGEIR